ncbi:MAG TPA: hypothetical protein EYH07_01830 [Kiloniellaceae bacterium]|nr:hypothetical protein [Kiloniellaceae bacterium]HIP77193.1 hypothetical protein [Kiloniellaceae bacterium]
MLRTLGCAAALLTIAQSALADDLKTHSSTFDTPADLAAWSEHRPEGFSPKWEDPRVEDGKLVLWPKSSGWFEDNQAGHLYKPVSGDFIATTRIEVRGTAAALPQTSFSLAGLFIRAPRAVSAAGWVPGQENWLFFSVGTAAPAGEPHYEIKSTTNSLSTLKILPSGTGPVDLRIARHGELFTLLVRETGGDWRVIDQMIRPDLPQVLNVGLTAYADYDSVAPTYPNYQLYNTQGAPTQNADLIAYVDSFTLRRPATGRLPIANIDAPAFLDVIAERRADLLSD